VEDSLEHYGINRWGRDYFTVNRKGHLAVRTSSTGVGYADVKEIVDHVLSDGLRTPMLLRFPQLISDRVNTLYASFRRAQKAYGYTGRLRAVFPMKVNQEREVIETVLGLAHKHDYGLEVGSKPELLAAIALKENPRSLLICNGFKDQEFVDLAFHASRYRKNVVVVLDRLDEVDMAIEAARKTEAKPMLGIRVKLYARGTGKWVESGGERAKFGLTVPGILEAVEDLRRAKLLSRVRMLHYHVGSQISDVKKVHLGLREAARIYADLVTAGVPLKLVDCGGGLGLDYDGSQTTSAMSVNYDVAEYVNTIVYTLKSICDDADVPYPDVVTESGRGVAGYHALLVAEVLPKRHVKLDAAEVEVTDDDPLPLHELHEGLRDLTVKNFIEIYHDALTHREDMMSLFNLGQIGMDARARGEVLFREICQRVLKILRRQEDYAEEYEEELTALKKLLAHKYVANYSLFQSTPDVWGIKQLFPITPIHRLNEDPGETATLCDLTCDSDGEVRRFIDVRSVKEVLELHEPNGEPYYLGFAMVGAYQDVLGNFHNMFGPVNEVFVEVDRKGAWRINKTLPGETAARMLEHMNYDPAGLTANARRLVEEGGTGTTREQDQAFLKIFDRSMKGYTYLGNDQEAPQQAEAGPNGARRRQRELEASRPRAGSRHGD
jgi:arginine decarboxylase